MFSAVQNIIMKEITEIIKAYSQAKAAGKKAALATVVKVEGSSYRQPGARMLVTEDGFLTGAISGGCLEGDALRKALLAINQQQNKLITYDTNKEDDVAFGIQLGCNGIVHILFEYIDESISNNAMQFLKQVAEVRKEASMLTVFSLKRNVVQIGTILLYRNDTAILHRNDFGLEFLSDIREVIRNKATIIKKVAAEENHYEALIEYIAPPVSLVIAGAGNDVQPLVKMADLLGWEVTLGDGRSTHSIAKRFPEAKKVLVAKPEQLVESIVIDSYTYFVLMTHNYKYDLEVLQLLLKRGCGYIGILGPKTKLDRMLDDLKKERAISEQELNCIYSPVGLDIGAETSEEIALSIVAEIKAVIAGKKGTSLKYKKDKIHNVTHVV
jgi:xanthine dehydrogenase accessory factor